VVEFDEHHKKLFDLINGLHTAIADNRDRLTITQLVAELVDYTRFHFAAEEALMEKHGYAGLTEHKARHDDLLDEIQNLKLQIDSGEQDVTMRLVDYMLQRWVLSHIQGMDMDYGPHLNDSGIN